MLAFGICAGCQNSSGNKSGTQGKTYTADSKGKQGAGGSSNGSAPPTSAETVSGKPSAASDSGTPAAVHGQVVLNPGAPAENKPANH